jgi:putative nucleotidyltransferase with HDIG domain
MDTLNGTLDNTSVAQILRLCAVQQKTGTLVISRAGISKTLYFNNGTLIYITSNKSGERVGEYLIQRGDLTRTWAGYLLKDSQRNGVSFTASLLEKNIFDKEKLVNALADLANTALADALVWTSGDFEFSAKLPEQVVNGAIRISEVKALQQVLQQGTGSSVPDDVTALLRTIARKISTDDFAIPLLAKVALNLQENWSAPSGDTAIIKLVRSDQVLSAYVLRVVNSSVGTSKYAATINQALELYSVDHLLGVVHAQVACARRPKYPASVAQMLQHALRCACLAKQIAAQLCVDQDMAFTCGLFHNIGKILLLQLLVDENVSDDLLPKMVAKYSPNSGALLSRRWNLDPKIHDCIKYYQQPQLAPDNQILVEIVHLSHMLLMQPDTAAKAAEKCTHLKPSLLHLDDLRSNLALIDEVVAAVY